jgi:hypothetical protein
VLCMWGTVVVTDSLLFFLGVLMQLGIDWKHGSAFCIWQGIPRCGAAVRTLLNRPAGIVAGFINGWDEVRETLAFLLLTASATAAASAAASAVAAADALAVAAAGPAALSLTMPVLLFVCGGIWGRKGTRLCMRHLIRDVYR